MARTSLILGLVFMLISFLVFTILSFIDLFGILSLILGGKSVFFSFINSDLFNIMGQASFLLAIIGGILLFLGFSSGIGRAGIVLTLIGDITGILSYFNYPPNILKFYTLLSLFLTSIGLILLGIAFYSKGSKGGGSLLVIGSVISILFGIAYLLSSYINFSITCSNCNNLFFLFIVIYILFEDLLPSLFSALGFSLILLKEARKTP